MVQTIPFQVTVIFLCGLIIDRRIVSSFSPFPSPSVKQLRFGVTTPSSEFYRRNTISDGTTFELFAVSFSTRRSSKDAATTTSEPFTSAGSPARPIEDRFERVAATEAHIDAPCILTIHGVMYNMTAWARAHPGGEKILLKFHGRDATKAFDAAGHSDAAYAMLKEFEIGPDSEYRNHDESMSVIGTAASSSGVVNASVNFFEDRAIEGVGAVVNRKVPRWRAKLFTKEDPIGVHKYMGVFSLLHFIFRYVQMVFGDPSCGMGSRLGKGPALIPILCLIPHAILSLSSLIFNTVPKERVVGKPMIWKEFRAHNIIFGVRSIICTVLAWACIYSGHNPVVRRVAVASSALSVLVSNAGADLATAKLRQNDFESTTATMPYWEGCSVETQKRFKSFYAYCQFLATLACVQCANPAWPLSVLLPIQLASLLMTLVRKGIISARAYHYAYTASLCMPFVVGVRHIFIMKTWDFPFVMGIGTAMYQLRRLGANKYALWLPVVIARIALGDRFINWDNW